MHTFGSVGSGGSRAFVIARSDFHHSEELVGVGWWVAWDLRHIVSRAWMIELLMPGLIGGFDHRQFVYAESAHELYGEQYPASWPEGLSSLFRGSAFISKTVPTWSDLTPTFGSPGPRGLY